MENLKSKIGKCLKNLEEKFKNSIKKDIKIVESRKNITYYSVFTFDKDSFIKIFNYIILIKENCFKECIDILKFAVKNFVHIFSQNNLLSEKEQVLILYSACFLHYYSKFAYEISNSFEEFYTNEFNEVLKDFHISILNYDLFKKFSQTFYNKLKSVILKSEIHYSDICKYYKYYNAQKIEIKNPNSAFTPMNQNNPIEILKQRLNQNNLMKQKKNLLTKMVSVKEHLVDVVLQFEKKNEYTYNKREEISEMLEQISNNSNSLINNEMEIEEEKKINQIKNNYDNNINNININNNNININDNSSFNNINNSNYDSEESTKSSSFYSKRILSELQKCEFSEEIQIKINEISEKVFDLFLDVLIYYGERSINIIKPFICYIVEINSNIIKILPEYQNLEENLIIRFIVPAIEIYHRVFEIYASIYDLKLTNLNTFNNILKLRNFEVKYSSPLFLFFKALTNEMTLNRDKVRFHMDEILESWNNKLYMMWDDAICTKGKELTHFVI